MPQVVSKEACLGALIFAGFLNQHSARMSQHSAKMAQNNPKITQHSLQEQPQDTKKPSKVMYSRRFLVFAFFAKIAPKMQKKSRQDTAKSVPSWPSCRQVAPGLPQDGANMTNMSQHGAKMSQD